jgi:hypothetical protein
MWIHTFSRAEKGKRPKKANNLRMYLLGNGPENYDV